LKRRWVTLWAWLTRFPNCGPLPQMSHRCAMTKHPSRSGPETKPNRKP
jgi:hypothetical protein